MVREDDTERSPMLTPFVADRVGWYTMLAVCCSCVGGLMFGYDTAVVSALLVLLKDDLGHHLSSFEKELVTSITSVGALFGSITSGIYADKFGRKAVIVAACVAFVGSSVFMALAQSVTELVTGRFLVGLAIGAASSVVPVYIAEVAPSRHRGRLVALNSLSTTFGQVAAYLCGWLFEKYILGWRYMLAIGAVPPAVCILVTGGIPESPRYLIKRDKVDEAEATLRKLHPSASFEQIQEMIDEQAHDSKQVRFSFRRLFSNKSNSKALLVACCLMASQILCGINCFMYYSSTMFETAGFKDPIGASMLVVSGTNFLCSIIPVFYIDKLGRRRMLLGTMWIMVLALITTAFTFNNSSEGALLVVATIAFIGAYASALGSVPWQAIEFLPLDVRALGSMMVSSTNWICNTLVSVTFLTALEVITPKGVFLVYAGITLMAYIGVYFCYPEVAGMSLEDISVVFDAPLLQLGKTNNVHR